MLQHSPEISEFQLIHFDLTIVHVDIASDHFDLGKHILDDEPEPPSPLLSGSFWGTQLKLLIMLTLIIIFSLAFFIDIV